MGNSFNGRGRGDRNSNGGGRGRDRMPIKDAASIDPATSNAAKPPLEWQLLNVFTMVGSDAMIELQKSEGFRGNLLYSIKIGRKPKVEGDRMSVYLRPDDLPAVKKLLDELEGWLAPPAAAQASAPSTAKSLPTTTTKGTTE